jgi:hypothetical protein
LSRALVGDEHLDSPQVVQDFVGRVQRFIEATTQWIEDTLELRRLLGSHLELRSTNTGLLRPALRSAAEVRHELLGRASGEEAAAGGYFLARFYDDVLAIIEGLLQGNQQVRRAIRERLDPQRLVEVASREARLGFLVQAAASSALWKAYAQAFQEVTADDGREQELARMLQQAAERRANRR